MPRHLRERSIYAILSVRSQFKACREINPHRQAASDQHTGCEWNRLPCERLGKNNGASGPSSATAATRNKLGISLYI